MIAVRASLSLLLLVSAVPALAQAEAGPPSEPANTFRRGVELAQSGSIEQAKTVFRALILAYPDLPEPYVNLAALLATSGDFDAAATTAEAGMRAHPVCRAAFQMELLQELGDYSARLLGRETPRAAERVVEAPEPRAIEVPAPPEPPGPEAEVAEITARVTAWARAWSDQEVDEYLAFYAPTFRPPGGMDRERWESQRRRRVAAPNSIEVALADLEIELIAPDRARATFIQRYRSDSYGDEVTKTLNLENVDGSWKIIAERTGLPEP